jgi:integrase
MSSTNDLARRVRVERNIYRRPTGTLEVGYRDSTGRQRWITVDGGVKAARAVRNDLLARRGRGERVQPNPTLRFGDAADAWLAGQVAEVRPATQAIYANAITNHLRPRWGRRRLDTITVEDVAALVRDLRGAGKAEWTIAGVLKAANRTFKFAKRRMNRHGQNPVIELESGERPRVSAASRRPIFRRDELAQTIRAAREPYRTLFALGSVTGARISECLGLVWADVAIDDLDAAEVRFEHLVDRHGHRTPLKTDESRRTVEIPRQLADAREAQGERRRHAPRWVRVRHPDRAADPAAERRGRPPSGADARDGRRRPADVPGAAPAR